jgi:cytochrome P450
VELMAADTISAMDPPEHSQYRKPVAAPSPTSASRPFRPQVTQIVDEAIDAMLAGPRPADLARAFSLAAPAQVICLLGVPSADVDQFSTWSNVTFGDCSRPPERIAEAQGAIGG